MSQLSLADRGLRTLGALPRAGMHAARIAAAVAFWPTLALVVWGELTTAADLMFQTIGDKMMHFAAYFGLAGMAVAAFRDRRNAVIAVFGLVTLGAVLEIVQSMVGRNASLWDEIANALGAISGGVISRVIVEYLRRRTG